MAKWKKQTLKLKDKHYWRCKPGYRILVLDRGAVRFDIPGGWVVKMDEESVKVLDREPPADDCRIEVSFNRLPPGDFTLFPVADALRKTFADDFRKTEPTGDAVNVLRHELRGAWMESRFIDPLENRPAYTRALLAIGNGIHCLITCEFWETDADRIRPVWDEVVRSLTLGVYVKDPRTGAANRPQWN